LGYAALAVCHAYARATLYQSDVVAGVMWERRSPAPGAGAGVVMLRSHGEAVMRWTARSLATAYEVGLAWITGKASRTHAQLSAGAAGARHPQQQQQGIPGSLQLCLRSAFFLVGQVVARWVLLPLPAVVAFWVPLALSSRALSCLLAPLFGFLLLFLLGKDSPRLRGRPWLVLFVLNSAVMLLASAAFLPPLVGLLLSALVSTTWAHKWALLALPLEWALSAALVPSDVWAVAEAGMVHAHAHAHDHGHAHGAVPVAAGAAGAPVQRMPVPHSPAPHGGSEGHVQQRRLSRAVPLHGGSPSPEGRPHIH